MGVTMNSQYEGYLKDCWKWSEKTATSFGVTDNNVVIAIFNKIASPYHFFKHTVKE